jgi:hypothetical protein
MRRIAILSLAFLPVRRAHSAYRVARILTAGVAILAVAMRADIAAAQATYRFVNIVDSSGPLGFISQQFSMNNHGVVAFYAHEDNSNGRGIFVGDGASTSVIAHSSGPYSSFLPLSRPAVNDSGIVAFIANLDAGGIGVFKSDGVSTTTIANAATYGAGTFSHSPAINESGTVAFRGQLADLGRGIFTGSGGDITFVTAALSADESRGPSTYIGDDGFIAFLDGTRRLAYADNGVVGTIIERGVEVDLGTHRWPIASFNNISMSDNNQIAFAALVGPLYGIYAVTDGVTTRIGDKLDQVRAGQGITINNSGDVAFVGSPRIGLSLGIYTGTDPFKDRVIGLGDPLFGSTVSSFGSWPLLEINDRGDIAFFYRLTDGVAGIALARLVPEPGSVLLCLAACLAWAARWHARRTPRRTSG